MYPFLSFFRQRLIMKMSKELFKCIKNCNYGRNLKLVVGSNCCFKRLINITLYIVSVFKINGIAMQLNLLEDRRNQTTEQYVCAEPN